ncbi:DotA/TraY family protein [Agrobacterium tumefaciens]|uniref:DotA/TraY family protein n=1 Tax=Agrobacterium tumefaciens TaxID=358 RepID=UPI0009BC6506|nr:DotA/TraY family protein [Agrobacterium tumefaciens]
MAKPDEIAGLFTPEDYSAGLVFLRRLVGCTFDTVWTAGGSTAPSGGGSCDSTNDILAQLIETMNWAMLAVVAVVSTYLIFASLKDTANDGEAGGRAMNPSWTLVIAGIGAILCFPAFNGFNALQIGTMQVAVWSSGLGDTLWRTAAVKMASANTVNAAFSSKSNDGWFYSDPSTEKALREQIAGGLATRVAGEICRGAISRGVASMATPEGGITTASPPPTFTSADDGYTQTVLTYQAGKGLNDSSGLCGSVTVSYAAEKKVSPSLNLANGLSPENVSAQTELANSAARFQAQAAKAGADALLASIRTEGDNLYKTLFPTQGERLRGQAQLTAIEKAVTNTIDQSKTAMRQALTQAPAEFKQHTNSAMTGNQKNGWFYAVLYQRVLVNATSSLSSLGIGGVEVLSNKPPENLADVFGCGGWFGSRCSNELEVFFSEYRRDTLGLAELEPAFRNAALNSSTHGVNSVTIGNANSGGGAVSRWLNDTMMDLADAEASDGLGWVDPIPQLQATGSKILTYGSGVLAVSGAGAAASALGKHPVVVVLGEMASLISPLGWALVTVGFILAVVVPFMPLVYFFLAALSWLVLAVQTIITAPFWLMQMFYPNRNGSLQGTSIARGLGVLLALLVRPALIIVGLVFCMLLMRVGLDFLNVLALNAFNVLATSNGGLQAGVGNMALALGGFVIYMSLAVMLVSYCCSLIDGVSDYVMEMVENGASRWLGSEKGRSESVLGSPTAAAAAGLTIGSRSRGNLAGTFARLSNTRQDRNRGQLGGTSK